MTDQLWVAGYPSFYGGADTELDHNIDLWRHYDIDVHLVPMFGIDKRMRELCDIRGCRTHEYSPDIFAGKVVISFCNGEFLKELPDIMVHGRPKCVLWANCMTWPFDAELAAHKAGYIDYFLFQSNYQRNVLYPRLSEIRKVQILENYRPFFSLTNSSANFSAVIKPEEYFGIGRISRDDANKFHQDTWQMFSKVCAPKHIKAFMLGFGDNAKSKCGDKPPCNWLDWMYWGPGGTSAADLYSRIHVLMHLTGGSGENWPRTILEAWASGVIPIVDADYGVVEMVNHGVDGFHARSTDEAAYLASVFAFDSNLRDKMVEAGRSTLIREHCQTERCIRPFFNLFSFLDKR
jgi:glycosyltransferase involved in cell wall biosynthesis